MNPKEMLMVFSQYGVRKTSMEDIARAAGVSRQSIYKRFGSKKGALEWVLSSFIENVVERAESALKNSDPKQPRETVLKVFEFWSGELVPILCSTPHGAEVLDTGMRFAEGSEVDWEGDLMSKLSEFLVNSGLTVSTELAREQANALNLASKGIMLKARSAEGFCQEMRRVIQVILRE